MALVKIPLPTQQELTPMSMNLSIAAHTQCLVTNASFTKCMQRCLSFSPSALPTSAKAQRVLVFDFVRNWREQIRKSTTNLYAGTTNSRFSISMAKSEVKLIGKLSSPYTMRVKIALNIKSLEYENFEETLNPKSDLLLQSNPVYGKVPVLIYHDRPICESLVIVEYIDETWSTPRSILPTDPYDRTVARFWAAYIDDKWFPSMKNIIIVEGEEERKPYFEVLEEVLERMEDAFWKCSKGKPFFGGDMIGFLDIAFGCFLGWLSVIEHRYERKLLVEAKAPALVKWAERFAADPAVKGLIPETDKLVEISKSLQIKWRYAIGKK